MAKIQRSLVSRVYSNIRQRINFKEISERIKHPRTEHGQMFKQLCYGVGICTFGITLSIVGLR